jgi:hypothetical protein
MLPSSVNPAQNPAHFCAAIVLAISPAISLTGIATAEIPPIVQPPPSTRQLLDPKPPDRQSELWWTKEQIEAELRSSKLISRWALSTDSPIPSSSVPTGPATLDVTINSQVWSVLDYFGRYEFANTIGIKANELGYGLRIMTDRGLVLGQYNCATIAPPRQCRVQLDSTGQRGQRNRSLF